MSITSRRLISWSCLRFIFPFLDAIKISLCQLRKGRPSYLLVIFTSNICVKRFHFPNASRVWILRLLFYNFAITVLTFRDWRPFSLKCPLLDALRNNLTHRYWDGVCLFWASPVIPLIKVFHLPLIWRLRSLAFFSLSLSITSLRLISCNCFKLILPLLDAFKISLCHLGRVLDSWKFLTLTSVSCTSLFHLPAASKLLSLLCYSFNFEMTYLMCIDCIPFSLKWPLLLALRTSLTHLCCVGECLFWPAPKTPRINVFHLPLIWRLRSLAFFSFSLSITSLRFISCNCFKFNLPLLDATRISLCHLWRVLDS